jgi:hypothetical protein
MIVTPFDGGRHRSDRRNRQTRNHQHDGGEDIGKASGKAVEQSRQPRTNDGPDLPYHRAQGDGSGQQIGRHDVGSDRTQRRTDEHPDHTMQRCHREQQFERKHVVIGRQGQRQRNNRIERDGQRGDAPAVEMIRDQAGDGRKHKQRDELNQPQQPQPERGGRNAHAVAATRQIVDLPAQHHHHPAGGQHRGEAGQQEKDEVADLKRVARTGHCRQMAGSPGFAK